MKFGVLVYLLSNDFGYINISIFGCWNFMGNDFGVQHNPILNESPFILLTYPLRYTTPVADTDALHEPVPRPDPLNTPSWKFCGWG